MPTRVECTPATEADVPRLGEIFEDGQYTHQPHAPLTFSPEPFHLPSFLLFLLVCVFLFGLG